MDERSAMVDGIQHTHRYWMPAGVGLLDATRARPSVGSCWYAAITIGARHCHRIRLCGGDCALCDSRGFFGTALIYGPSPGPIPIGPLPLVGALYSFLVWPAGPCSAVSNSSGRMVRNISLTSSGSRTVFCSFTRIPAGVKIKPRHRASLLSRLLVMYPARTNRATVMLIVDRPTPMCSASFDRVVGRVACR